jgi:sigma-B regulation protein RsbU (phosphoserine phosphatase)
MQILVADDDPVYIALLKNLLGELNMETLPASDGAEAWAVLQRPDAPGIAILDWQMPNMDGFEVCQLVRRAPRAKQGGRYPLPYILLMTSHTSRDDLLRIIVAGVDDYILKPFEPLDLKIRLRTAVRIVNLEEQLRDCP